MRAVSRYAFCILNLLLTKSRECSTIKVLTGDDYMKNTDTQSTFSAHGKKSAEMLYDKKADFNKCFISAPISLTEDECDFPKAVYDLGKWVFPNCAARTHMRKDFVAKKDLSEAVVELQSENPVDFFINGKLVNAYRDKCGFYLTGQADISLFVADGNNKMALRVYLSDKPENFLTALRGAVVLTYTDGTQEKICFDDGWKITGITSFWNGVEPTGWQERDLENFRHTRPVCYLDAHPKQLRRGCYFRKDFKSEKTVESAILYSSAKGLYVPYINGERVTEARFIPGSMEKVTEYQVFDVTSLIAKGDNVLCAETGSGWYNCTSWGTLSAQKPLLMMHLEIKYTDGTSFTVETDKNWLVGLSPRTQDDIQFGERYDARLERQGWNLPGALEGRWEKAQALEVQGEFTNQSYPPVKVQGEIFASSMGTLADGGVYYDFKVNSTGRAKIVLKNTKRGERIFIRYCEIIENGVPYVGTYGDVFFEQDTKADGKAPYGARNIDVYICKGAEEEIYLPEFAFTGFRYVYIYGYGNEYELGTVRKIEMNSDLKQTGDIYTSHSGISRIWDAVKRSWRSNIFTGPTDCPTREKNFWNGDIQVFATTASWYNDTNAILSSWTKYGRKIQYGVYGWEDEEYILPLILYKFYGNKEVVAQKYPVVKSLIDKRKAGLSRGELPVSGSPYCDHEAIKKVPEDFFVGAYYCYMYKCASVMAGIVGNTDDEKEYLSEFEACRKTFNKKFYIDASKDYSPTIQGGIVFPVAFGIAESENLPHLAKKLCDYVVNDGYHLTTGFMGNEHNLGILFDYGYGDTAWKVLNNKEHPSLLNMIDSYGGGTTTENWEGYKPVCGYSMNHYAIGNTARVFFEHFGGLKITAPGFEKVSVKPCLFEEMGDFEVTYETKAGELSSKWVYTDNGVFNFTLKVPKGIAALFFAPDGFEFTKDKEKTFYEVTDGEYNFGVRRKPKVN